MDFLWETIISFKPIIYLTAKKYYILEDMMDDIMQEAMLFLYFEIPKYDESKGLNFKSFIIQRLNYLFYKIIRENSYSCYVSKDAAYLGYKIHYIKDDYFNKTGKEITDIEIAEIMNVSVDKIRQMEMVNELFYKDNMLSLEECLECSNSSDFCVGYDVSSEIMEDEIIDKVFLDEVFSYIDNSFKDKESGTIYKLNGFETGEALTLEKVANCYNETFQSTHKRYKKLIKNIRNRFDINV